MKTFRCWAPQLEAEVDAREYVSNSPRDAAEAFSHWSYREEPFEDLEVRVRCPNGDIIEFSVGAEMELQLDIGAGHKVASDEMGPLP